MTSRSSAVLHGGQVGEVPPAVNTDASAQAQLENVIEEQELFDSKPPLSATKNCTVFRATWRAVNVFLLVSLLVAAYALLWELSTRRYLQGFSDAIVPTAAFPQEKVLAILQWMSHGPTRRAEGPVSDRGRRISPDTLSIVPAARAAFLFLLEMRAMRW